jgi:hypothetical protein
MTIERWKLFSKSRQLLMIGSEIMRAKIWQAKDEEKFISALERCLDLIDLSLQDSRWRGNYLMLLYLRDEVGKFYIGENKESIEILYKAL